MITIEQIAHELHCHPETIRRHIRGGSIRAVRLDGFRRLYIPLEEYRRLTGGEYHDRRTADAETIEGVLRA